MKNIIQISKLHKSFSVKGAPLHVVRGLNLTVKKGEIFGFLGPNGAGKTTTLKMLTTLLPPDSGDIVIAGYHIDQYPNEVRKKIGYVSQVGGADRSATGIENLILQGRLYGMSASEAKKQAEKQIKIFSLEEFSNRFVSTYSGGQRRRLDIALGILHHPDILFLDEPTSGLDPHSRANLWDQIRQIRDEGTTVFLTSHYLDEVDELSDSLAIMEKGEIVAQGTPSELKKQILGDVVTIGLKKDAIVDLATLEFFKKHPFVRDVTHEALDLKLYVEDGESAIPEILRLLDSKNIALQTLNLSLPTLNDVFLKKTGRALRESQ